MKKNILLIIFLTISIVSLCYSQSLSKSKLFAFKNVNVISMLDDKIIENQTIIIEDGIIKTIGECNEVEIPKGSKTINAKGKYIMPGLADMHVHLLENYYNVPNLNLFLANGITTIRDMHGASGRFILDWKQEIESGIRPGPSIIAGSPILHTISPDVESEINGYIEEGFEFIKIYSDLPRKDFERLLKFNELKNIYTVGHLPFSVSLNNAIESGLDEIAHVNQLIPELIEYDRDRDLKRESEWEEYVFINLFMKLFSQNQTSKEKLENIYHDKIITISNYLKSKNFPITSTLYCDYVVSRQIRYNNFIKNNHLKYLPISLMNKIKKDSESLSEEMKKNYEFAGLFYNVLDSMFIKELNNKNTPIILGTDVGATNMGIVPGFSIHNELDLLVKFGLSPYEAIKTGTVNANLVAKSMGLDKEFGTIEVGKKADLILLENNPLENISYLRNNKGVMASGKWYSDKKLRKMLKINKNNMPTASANILFEIFKKKGFEAMISEYNKANNAIQSKDRKLILSESELNSLGYKFFVEDLINEALVVFKLNVKAHPYSANCYDSLAEAYLKSGDKTKAIKFYNKAILLNPYFENPRKALAKIK